MLRFCKTISPLSLILVPLKQHLGCCIILPILLKIFALTALGELLHRLPHAELVLGLILLPLVVYLCLRLEDAWKIRAHRKKIACNMICCNTKLELGRFLTRFTLNLFVGALLVLLVYNIADSNHHHDDSAHRPIEVH